MSLPFATRLPHRADRAIAYWQSLGPHARTLVETGWLGVERHTAVLQLDPDSKAATVTYKAPGPAAKPATIKLLAAHLPRGFDFERAAVAWIAQLPSRIDPADFLD